MSIYQVETFLRKIFEKDYQTPEEALQAIRQTIRDRQVRIRQQCVQLNELRKKMMKKRSARMQNISTGITKNFRCYILDGQQVELSDHAAKYSHAILVQLCRLMKQKVPRNDSVKLVDRILGNIADKLAQCMINFITCSDFRTIQKEAFDRSDCAKERLKSYPIDDYYPHEEEVQDEEAVEEELEVEEEQEAE